MTLNQVKFNYDNCMKSTKTFIDEFPWENKYAYMNWLAQSYYFVSHSTRLLALSAATSEPGDNTLHKRMLQHIVEEIGHEMIAANDIKQLGDNVTNFAELVETKAFYQSQYYYIQNKSAASFIGYVLFLEGLASTKGFDIYKRITAQFGEKACHFVRVHAEEDQGHIQSAFKLVEALPASTYNDIIMNMNQSTYIYQKMMEEITYQVATHQRYMQTSEKSVAI